MKFRVLLACLTCVLTVAHAETREFTNTDGKTIKGEVTSVSTTQAVIKRESDRKIFTIPLASLSAADQEFLARWREENPEFILSFAAERQKENQDNTRSGNSNVSTKVRSGDVCYRITVTNKGKSATPAARLLFYNQLEVNGKPDGLFTQKEIESRATFQGTDQIKRRSKCHGTLELPVIEPGKSVDLVTPSVQLVASSSVSANWTPEGTEQYVSKSKETINGISLIVQYREREVAAWTTPGSDRKLTLFRDFLRQEEEERIWKAKRGKHH